MAGVDLLDRLRPPARFADVRFETYVPSPDHPSQGAALAEMERFAAAIIEGERPAPRGFPWPRRRLAEPSGGRPGRYLDGGFGVGKTHLLASLWQASPPPAAYLTFAELTSLIGFLGMDASVALFSGYRLLCIDEFELDDVANTLMVVTFLRGVVPVGVRVAATSNAIPDRLGEGRFHAADFRREIAAIAAHFDVVRIDGPDFRARAGNAGDPLTKAEADALVLAGERAAGPGGVSDDAFDAVLAHLRTVHPVQFGALLDGLGTVVLRGLHPIANQGDALLFVHLVDELYDAARTVGVTGCTPAELFPPAYRHGGYRTKYGRCESRLAALLAEARARLR